MNCSCCDLSLVPPPSESEAGRGGTPSGHRPPRTSSAGRATCRCERVTWGVRPVARDPGTPPREWPSDLGPVQRVTPPRSHLSRSHRPWLGNTRLARGGRARACVRACLCSQPPPRTPRAGRAEWACGEESLRGVAGVPAVTENAGRVHGDMRTCRLPSAALGVAPAFTGAAYSTSCARMCWETIRIVVKLLVLCWMQS